MKIENIGYDCFRINFGKYKSVLWVEDGMRMLVDESELRDWHARLDAELANLDFERNGFPKPEETDVTD